MLLQVAINGLIAGSIYALVSSGFSLIYNTNKFMHFAHGASVAVSGYFLYGFFAIIKLNFFYSLSLTLIFSALLGLLIYRIIYLPLQNRKASNVILLIASISILILLQNLILLLFGANVKDIEFVEVKKGLEFFGAVITLTQIVILLTAVLFFIFLYFFMNKTILGKNMRAVSENKELASIVGINSRKISDFSFLIGSFLGGAAGILIAVEQNITPTMGTILMIKGFTGAVIGGISSVPAAVLGSYLLGLAENFGIVFLPSGYKDAISFVLLFLFLLFRPEGIIGGKRRTK
ncbi:branched-chain amino acid ABC transporter permease [Candidatus Pacearchaeota archaeon]|nr:branched-chain amino acid ABC transporter permease [Candidatus Pacearchaeota archaeon]